MNKLVTLASSLNTVLLTTDEEEYDKIAYDVVQQFNKITDLSNSSLDTFDPSYQTIVYLYVLDAHIAASLNSGKAAARQLPAAVLPQGRLWPYISNILLNFDPIQVRYAGALLIKIIELVARGAEQARDPVPAIQLLQHVILRLDPLSSTLTTTHYHYIRLCVLAQAYSEAIIILEHPIYSIPSADTTRLLGNRAYKYLCSAQESSSTYLSSTTGLTQPITTRIFLEYFLLGAICYIGIGSEGYKKAIHFLNIVLVTPTSQNATSVIQLEAYKKWVLLQIITTGTSTEAPKSLSQPVIRNLRTIAKPYECLADAFKTSNGARLQQEVEEGSEIWQADGNEGLVHELFAAFTQFQLVRLEETYVSLPAEQIAEIISGDQTNTVNTIGFLTEMIRTGKLNAQLVPSETGGAGTLRFASEQSNHMSETEIEGQLASRSLELQQLLKRISEIDHQMEINKEYIEWLQKLRAARDRDKKSSTVPNRATVTDMHDEDMMDDI